MYLLDYSEFCERFGHNVLHQLWKKFEHKKTNGGTGLPLKINEDTPHQSSSPSRDADKNFGYNTMEESQVAQSLPNISSDSYKYLINITGLDKEDAQNERSWETFNINDIPMIIPSSGNNFEEQIEIEEILMVDENLSPSRRQDSGDIKQHLYWPGTPHRKNTKPRNTKENIPYVLTSTGWKNIFQTQEDKKEQEERKKEERKAERLRKKTEKVITKPVRQTKCKQKKDTGDARKQSGVQRSDGETSEEKQEIVQL